MADSVYRLSERYYDYHNDEYLSHTRYYNGSSIWEIVVFNNTMAKYDNGHLAPWVNYSIPEIIPDVFACWHLEPISDIDYDYRFPKGHEHENGSWYLTLGFFQDQSISIEVKYVRDDSISLSRMTYIRDFQGDVQVIETKPDYPLEYFVQRGSPLRIFSSPDLEHPLDEIEIPVWAGEFMFSNWEESSHNTSGTWRSPVYDFSRLDPNELPMFTILDRLDGNDVNDPEKRWYQVVYNGITGYILVDPRLLTTSEDYLRSIDSRYNKR
jgi:hypothetical protein